MDVINQETAANKELMYWESLANDLEGLEKDPRFQRLILEGYFKDKAISGVSILANDNVKRSGARTDVMEGLIAISALQDYFLTIKAMSQTTDDLENEEETEE